MASGNLDRESLLMRSASGTTWLGRVVPALALELCGSFNNQWCQVGGMTIIPHPPASLHEFELLKRNIGGSGSPELFLHFKGIHKHIIPGMDLGVPVSCRNGGRLHRDYFLDLQPCASDEMPTRDRLVSCLYDTSASCVRHMPSADPAVRRSIVIMRDPRNVVISEYMMRTQVIERERWTRTFSLDEFIMWKFEVLVSWIHQRYMWHTGTLMGPSSHITVYEELQRSHLGLIDIAGFMGLQCSEQQAAKVWIGRRHPSPSGGYASRGLSVETVSFMNATMARLLPPALALRWDVTPTEL
ncbi:unnamed protein product [Ectocarpus sp. CCAP 1310/34]|nr:unnamed protein product [Ectocarpus sp. CCAP 1310/34]